MFTRKPKLELEVAVNTAGWLTYPEIVWLATKAQSHHKIVEIGSYLGKSTSAMAENTPGFVVAVDNFKGPMDKNIPKSLRDDILETFLISMGPLIESKKIIPVVSDHSSINIDFSPDMVFIDGSHLYEDVKRDISIWYNRLESGGLLCGHDYTNIEDVKLAVAELLPKAKIAKDTSIWYYEKP